MEIALSIFAAVKRATRPIRAEAFARFDKLRRRILLRYRIARGAFSNVVLTYDAEAFPDGAGSQYHRILGIYALARSIGAEYQHTPIRSLAYVGIPGSNPSPAEQVIDYINGLLPLKTDAGAVVVAAAGTATLQAFTPSDPKVPRGLVKTVFPHGDLDRFPALWNGLRDVLPLREKSSGPLRIGLHVRRGELNYVAKDRLLPNTYYLNLARNLTRMLDAANIEHKYELFSERSPVGRTLNADDFAFGMAHKSHRLDEDPDKFYEFEGLRRVQFFLNLPLEQTIDRLVSADVLVTSKSSLSFVVGILNPDRLILWHPFWHSPLPGWELTDEDGVFDEASAMARLNAWRAR